jgi:4-hydroxy-tetrahydrodipicolinate synthase
MRFRSDPSRIRGSIAPIVTPFDEDGAVDPDALARLVEWQIESGSHGISVLGSTGEPSAQTVAERIRVLEVAARTVADRVPFFPGTGTTHLAETLELTAAAEALGADAALVITPYYSRPTQDGLFEWYSTLAREFPSLPIVVYNVPIRTAVDIHPVTVGRLRRAHENIVGIKETTRDFEHGSHVLSECGRDFLVYCGIELLCYPMLAIGGAGHLSCVANVAPKPCADLYDVFVAGDLEAATRLHYELHPLVEMAFVETNPGPVKWAMERLGILASGRVRPPLASPTAASRERIEAILADVGLLEGVPAA